jgi:hypothetical protein
MFSRLCQIICFLKKQLTEKSFPTVCVFVLRDN